MLQQGLIEELAERPDPDEDDERKKYWPYADPVGQRIRIGANPDNENAWMTIVGVVGDTKRAGLDVPVFTESYQPMRQAASGNLAILVRGRTGAAAGIGPAIRAAVREIDPQQPVSTVAPLQSMLDETVAGRRFSTLLVTIFVKAGRAVDVAHAQGDVIDPAHVDRPGRRCGARRPSRERQHPSDQLPPRDHTSFEQAYQLLGRFPHRKPPIST